MARRGRRPKSLNFLGSIDPKTARRVVGVAILILAVILILAEVHAAGSLGREIFDKFYGYLGIISYFFAFWMIVLSLYTFNPELFERQRAYTFGSFLFLLFFSATVSPFGTAGGSFGRAIFNLLARPLSEVAALIIFLILTVSTLIFTFNISIGDVFGWLADNFSSAFSRISSGSGVPIFRAVRRRIGMGKGGNQQSIPQVAMPDGNWQLPSIELLEESSTKAQAGNIAKNADVLLKTLADFGVEVSAGTVNIGPTVTQYELKPSEGVKLNMIKARADDLALALAVHPVRVEAPIPGKSAVGVEVPNKTPARVTLRELIDSDNFKKRKSCLTLPLGRDVSGEVITVDVSTMPHMLVAGATGSGKSVALNAFLLSLMFQNSPRDLRLLLVDPKRVEFTLYNGVPHLLTPVVTEVDKTINLLRWAISEMEKRFKMFERFAARDINSFNEKIGKGHKGDDGTYYEKLPFIVIVIDELADLMAQASSEVEAAIVRLAQLARATGIHLIVATQRPSVDVITGIIKANITCRVAFAVASQVDSRTILDLSGADKLLGNGDMLYIGGDYTKPKRIQGAFVTEKDVKSVTDFLKSEGSAIYNNSITEYHDVPSLRGRKGGGIMSGEGDELMEDAKAVVVESGNASATYLQRRLKVGYARAARLLDLLEEGGIVGPGRGAKPRDILVDSYDSNSDDENGGNFNNRNF